MISYIWLFIFKAENYQFAFEKDHILKEKNEALNNMNSFSQRTNYEFEKQPGAFKQNTFGQSFLNVGLNIFLKLYS